MAGYPGTWEWVATLAPVLKNYSNLMKSIGLKVAKYPYLFYLNMTKSEALLCLKNYVYCQFRTGVTETPPRAKTLPPLGTGNNLRATVS